MVEIVGYVGNKRFCWDFLGFFYFVGIVILIIGKFYMVFFYVFLIKLSWIILFNIVLNIVW